MRKAKQYLTFAGGTPFQHAGAAALGLGDEVYTGLADELRGKRDRLCAGLEAAGLAGAASPPARTSPTPTAGRDGAQYCRELVERAGVVAIPTGVFYDDPEAGASLVRFAFCKREDVIDEAARRLATAA